MSRSPWAVVNPAAAAAPPWCPPRLATWGPLAGDEQATASTAVAIRAATAPHARARPGGGMAALADRDLRGFIVGLHSSGLVCLPGAGLPGPGLHGPNTIGPVPGRPGRRRPGKRRPPGARPAGPRRGM